MASRAFMYLVAAKISSNLSFNCFPSLSGLDRCVRWWDSIAWRLTSSTLLDDRRWHSPGWRWKHRTPWPFLDPVPHISMWFEWVHHWFLHGWSLLPVFSDWCSFSRDENEMERHARLIDFTFCVATRVRWTWTLCPVTSWNNNRIWPRTSVSWATFGSCTNAPPVFAPGGMIPVDMYFRHSIIVVFPDPFGPTITVNGVKNVITCVSWSRFPKLRMPWIDILCRRDIVRSVMKIKFFSVDVIAQYMSSEVVPCLTRCSMTHHSSS